MSALKEQWGVWREKFSQLSEREKWLLTVAGWIGILFMMYSFAIDPVTADNNAKRNQISSLNGQIGQLQGEIAVVRHKLKQDPNKDIEKEFSVLIAQSQELSSQLSTVVNGLVTPSGMAELLQSVLEKTHKLTLVSLTSLPSEAITIDRTNKVVGYYIHPVQIQLTGNYFDIAEYLMQLEHMPVKYYWRSFKYQVVEYPQAQLEFVVYTLGAKEEFIGG